MDLFLGFLPTIRHRTLCGAQSPEFPEAAGG